jgi:AraC family transcriptional regulator of adaptative response/methylated-DNA-[protein]-cysteine methyltransferase
MPNPGQQAPPLATDPRWEAVLARDPQADGRFCYAVVTTGVYCRPTCPARRPKPEHVRFYATASQAEAAGYRPCKRCHPDRSAATEARAALVATVCRAIENAEQPPTLKALARQARMSPFHLHRLFKAATGITPKAYARAHRARAVRTALIHGGTVTEAIHEAGYNASGHFYAESKAMLGMTPRAYRAGGAEAIIRFALGQCSLGAILVAASQQGICAIALGDDPAALLRDLEERFPRATLLGGNADFERLVAQVVGLVETPGLGLDLPLDIRGTAFQQRVWQALQRIPAGTTASYAEIARRIGAPGSHRAVARACAANALAVAIPCHRVVRTDGGLAGYRWGLARKQALLAREAAQSAAE